MEPTAETIGERILKRRKAKGISRGELAKLAGLAYSTLADIENGNQNSTTKLHKVAAALGVRIEWLETGALPMEQLGVRDAPRATTHGVHVEREGALLGAEWEKIENTDIRKLVHDFVHGVVAAQKRAERGLLTTGTKDRKNKERRVSG